MEVICEKEKCTGCYSCINACPFNAIEMVKDDLGFVYPEIDQNKCKNCGICKKKCPQLKEQMKNQPLKAYAMYSRNANIRSESTSGGIAALLYEYIIEIGGTVYGVSSELKNKEIEFIRVSIKKDLYKLKGSKYVHAYVKNLFTSVKKDLDDNKDVLFIGTPCQIAGLKTFLSKEYSNLYTVDIICHGVPSQQLLYDELKLNNLKDIDKITFRDINGFNFSCFRNGKEVLNIPCRKNHYYRNFLAGNTYRKSCYSCQYAGIKRISDITIGDFWGLNNDCKIKDDENKGISLVMPITEKGTKLLEQIKEKLVLEERTIKEAEDGNDQLRAPVRNIKKRIKFEKTYKKNGYLNAMKKMITLKDRLKSSDFIYLNYQKIKNKSVIK